MILMMREKSEVHFKASTDTHYHLEIVCGNDLLEIHMQNKSANLMFYISQCLEMISHDFCLQIAVAE